MSCNFSTMLRSERTIPSLLSSCIDDASRVRLCHCWRTTTLLEPDREKSFVIDVLDGLLNSDTTWFSKSIGMAMLRVRAVSDKVRMHA
jgi:hypothetical protein